MAAVSLVDVTVHIDETLNRSVRIGVMEDLREIDGVVSVRSTDQRPHLMMVEYVPDRTSSRAILADVERHNLHAELVGL